MPKPGDATEHRVAFSAMASECEICTAGLSQAASDRAAVAAIREVIRIEEKYSRYRPDSIVTKINGSAGRGAVTVDAETAQLIRYLDALHQESGGLFDATSGVLRRAWDFKTGVVPAADLLAATRALIGWDRVQLDGRKVRLEIAGMELDFGGVGKEYAADAAATFLIKRGVRHGFVNLGGDIRVIGPRPGGDPWLFGIRHPRNPEATIASIPLVQGGLASSGDYERYFERNGRRYCHILNPQSGHPVSTWQSVSVIAPLAVAAGSYATIAMLKEAEALPWLEASGLAYLAVNQKGEVFSKAVT